MVGTIARGTESWASRRFILIEPQFKRGVLSLMMHKLLGADIGSQMYDEDQIGMNGMMAKVFLLANQ